MAQIFISYKRVDNRTMAEALHARLELLGYITWFDQEAEAADARWRRRTTTEIKHCDAFIVLIGSPPETSNSSKEEFESALAILESKPIIVGITAPTDIPDALQCYQRVDLTHDAQSGLDEIVDRVQWLLSDSLATLKLNLRTPIDPALLDDDLVAATEPLEDVQTAYTRASGTNKKFVLLGSGTRSADFPGADYISSGLLIEHEVGHLLRLIESTHHGQDTMRYFRDRRIHVKNQDKSEKPALLTWLQALILSYLFTRHINEVLHRSDSSFRVLVMPATEAALTKLATLIGKTLRHEPQQALAFSAHTRNRSNEINLQIAQSCTLDGNIWEWIADDHLSQLLHDRDRRAGNTTSNDLDDTAPMESVIADAYADLLRDWIAAARTIDSHERKACRLMLRVVEGTNTG
jgi:hypothetical protein